MAPEKKRRLTKKNSAEVQPIVETVMEDISYTANTSLIVQNESHNGSGGVGGGKTVKIKKEVKPRSTTRAKSSISSGTIDSAATSTIKAQSPSNTVQLKHETRGRTKKGNSQSDSKSTERKKRLYYEEEAEEGEENEEDEDDEEEEEDEDDVEDEEDEDQNINGEGQDEEYVANHNEYYEDNNKVNSKDHQEEPTYAIELDHNIISHGSARPPIGNVVVSSEFYKRLAQKQTAPQSTNMYAPSFNAPKLNQANAISSGSGSSVSHPPQMVSQSSILGKSSTKTSSSPFGGGYAASQQGSMNNRSYPIQNVNQQSSPLFKHQQSPMTTSSPAGLISINHQTSPVYKNPGNNEPLRPKLIAYYTVAMNALDSVSVDLQTKVGYEQANSAIVTLLNETTSYYKAVYLNETPALEPPTSSKDHFADSILKSGNLLGEYKVLFREYESAMTSQSLASAQLKHALAHKQHIESKLLHIKSQLQQLQYDNGK